MVKQTTVFPTRTYLFGIVQFLLLVHVTCRQADDRSKFLYLDNPSAKDVVWEYQSHMHAPHFVLEDLSDAHRDFASKIRATNTTEQTVRPFFLREDYPIPRVVAFYSPWCGSCQRFVPRYITTARAVLQRLPSYHAEFYAVSCSEHHDLCQQETIRSFPTLRAYKAYSKEHTDLHTFTVPSIDQGLDLNLQSMPNFDLRDDQAQLDGVAEQEESKIHQLDILGATQDAYRHTRSDVYRDAALSFTFALENHIFDEGQQSLTPEQTKALTEWLDLLYWTLPPTWMVHALINDLRRNIQTVSNSKEVMLAVVQSHRKVVHDKKDMQWSEGCRNGEGVIASFSCGLWCLFHIVSVGVPERHAAVLGHRHRVSTVHAAETIKDYVANFFSWCPQCREQFLQLYDTCAFQRCRRFRPHRTQRKRQPAQKGYVEFPIWLWQVHNDINEKLMAKEAFKHHRRKATASEMERARWPPQDACTVCYRSNDKWIKDRIYEYLKEEYW